MIEKVSASRSCYGALCTRDYYLNHISSTLAVLPSKKFKCCYGCEFENYMRGLQNNAQISMLYLRLRIIILRNARFMCDFKIK